MFSTAATACRANTAAGAFLEAVGITWVQSENRKRQLACVLCVLDVRATPPASFVRVPYEIALVTRAIRASELPPEFAIDLDGGGAATPAECRSAAPEIRQ